MVNKNNEKQHNDKKAVEEEKERDDVRGEGSIIYDPFKGNTLARSPLSMGRFISQNSGDGLEDDVFAEEKTDAETVLQEVSKVSRAVKGTPKSDGENDPWNDEDIDVSPIFQLFKAGSTGRGSYTKGNSPKTKKRKREEEQCKPELSDEVVAVLKALEKVTQKTEVLLEHIKGSSKTKTEIKTVSKKLGHVGKILNKRANELKRVQE
ncbi:hypothetical protein QE152_g33552 [Popillia japonica]|uniref:Uncharacterized protein n=1 Tax=Popillia japonica TaxID=7064 RepID=A0AAW1IWR1_POPJA